MDDDAIIENYDKVEDHEDFLPIALLNQWVKETDIPKKYLGEKNSELWYETLTGKGKIIFDNNTRYYGKVRYGIFESGEENFPCTITFSDGTKYEGDIHNNMWTGFGTFYFPTGAIYKGEVLNGLRHGQGSFQSLNGITYDGSWRHGWKHGNGVMNKGNTLYDGEWENGEMNGRGVMKWESGNIYDGEFVQSHIQGHGFMIWYNLNEKYTGNWKDDLQDGKGIQTWYDIKTDFKYLNNRYIGEWSKGKRNGYGIFYYSNGSKYEGTWSNNLKEGFGKFTYNDGTSFIGLFHDDQWVSPDNTPKLDKIREYINNLKSPDSVDSKSKINSPKRDKSNKTKKKGIEPLASINPKKTQKIKALEVITEVVNDFDSTKNNKPQDESIKKWNSESKSNKGIIKELNKFHIFLDFSDWEDFDTTIKACEKETENIFLRNLSEMRRWYLTAFKFDIETDSEEARAKKEREEKTPPYGINSNKIFNCMEMKDLYRFFRDGGIWNEDFSLAEFNTVYFKSENTPVDLFYVPEEWEQNDVYDYLLTLIEDSKINFANKHKEYIEYYNIVNKADNITYLYDITEKRIKNKTYTMCNTNHPILPELITNYSLIYKDSPMHFDIHSHHNILFLRHFYDALGRVAFVKYQNKNIPFSEKINNIFMLLHTFKPQRLKGKGNSNQMSKLEMSFQAKETQIQAEQIKVRNIEYIKIDEFINNNEVRLKPLFTHLYFRAHFGKSKDFNNMTISYNFFYNNVVKRSRLLMSWYDTKSKFVECIHHFYKIKPDPKVSSVSDVEMFDYQERLLETEFIFYEFEELIFFICRKYILRKRIEDKWENYIDCINRLWSLIKIDPLAERVKRGKECVFYPKNNGHKEMERLLEIEKKKEEMENLRKQEEMRYWNERRVMVDEDKNVYMWEEEAESDEFED